MKSTFGYFLTTSLRDFGRFAAGFVAPPTCCLCFGEGQSAGSLWGLDLCTHCEAACPCLRNPCPRCAQPLPADGRCAGCAVQPPPFDAAFAAFAYAHPVDHLVRELKFRHTLPAARVLGMLLAERRGATGLALPDVLVPVPLHRDRFIERGFNQAELIARAAARRLGVPLRTGVLRRQSGAPAQSGLSAEARRENLRAAFVVRGHPPPHVAVIDDVLTTGSTASEAARALKRAGAARVEIWVAARALPPARLDDSSRQ
jgi:ComF family protein